MPENYELPLTDDEIAKREFIETNINHLVMIRVEHDGHPRAALAAIYETNEGVEVLPVALIADNDLVDQMNPGPEAERIGG
jgi:hypothetical protein